jgi:Tfp pilus assembly protein PilE
MAGNKLNHRVRASTLVEVIIAMVVTVLVFGIAMMIFSNILRVSISAKKIKARAALQESLLKAEQNIDKGSQVFSLGEFKIVQAAKPYSAELGLTEMHLSAYDENNQLTEELKKVVRNNP